MSTLTNTNILVTGGDGLVGSHLVEALLQRKPAKLVVLSRDRDPQSYFFASGFEKQVTLAYGDLKDKERIFDIVTKYEIDYIFHLGAQAIVHTAFINPYETLMSNIMGTTHILEAARLSPRIQGVVVASSDKAYGKDCISASETHELRGDHPYDVSKSCTDLIAQAYTRTYGVPVAISRCGNIFGPGDLNFNRIVPGAMKAIIKNENLEIRSNGEFIRDYVYVKDVVAGYILLAENIERVKGEAFNFSTGYNYSVLELLKKIEEVLGKKIQFSIRNTQHNEIPEQSLNYEKAVNVLGWKPIISIEGALTETLGWYTEFLSS